MEHKVKKYSQLLCLLLTTPGFSHAMRPPRIKLPKTILEDHGLFYASVSSLDQETREVYLPIGAYSLHQLAALLGSPVPVREKNTYFKEKVAPWYGDK